MSAHAYGIGYSVLMFLLCCLVESSMAQLILTTLKFSTALLNLRHCKKLLHLAAEQCSQQVVSSSVLSAHSAHSAMII